MLKSAKDYMAIHYKTMKREDIINVFKISKIKYGFLLGVLYDENADVKKFVDDKIFKLKSEGFSHLDISNIINFSYKRVCKICKAEKINKEEDLKFKAKKEKYYKFIKSKFQEHKQKAIDFICTDGEDYNILNELNLENKIKLLAPTEKDRCVRVCLEV